MKITVTNTDEIRTLPGGRQARVWEGETESGIPVYCLILVIAVHRDDDCAEFERELQEPPNPASDRAKIVFEPRLF